MLRITRETDYGVVLLTRLATAGEGVMLAASDLANDTRIPQPTVSKILKVLTRGGILASHRGAKGGYSLLRSPEAITVAEIIEILEGPIALTDCVDQPAGNHADCQHVGTCPVQANWNRINRAIQDTLAAISLAEMAKGAPPLRANGNGVGIGADGTNGSAAGGLAGNGNGSGGDAPNGSTSGGGEPAQPMQV